MTTNSRSVLDPPEQIEASLQDRHRLLQLANTRLLESLPEESFDRYTRLATSLLHLPISLVSLINGDGQYLKSNCGLMVEPFQSLRKTPLSHSICQYVVHTENPVIIPDTSKESFLSTNLAPSELGVKAYMGFPIDIHGQTLGSFCVMDTVPRHWSAEEISAGIDFASAVITEIQLRCTTYALDLAIHEINELKEEVRPHHHHLTNPIKVLTKSGALTRGVHKPAALHSTSQLASDSLIDYAFKKAMERGTEASILYMGLDQYKNAFDSIDQDIGYRFLDACARSLRECLQPGDHLICTEESEFLTILMDTSKSEATFLAEKMRQVVHAVNYRDSKRDFSDSLSIGLTSFQSGAAKEEVIETVLAAFEYAQANHGNNVVTV